MALLSARVDVNFTAFIGTSVMMTIAITPAESVDRYVLFFLTRAHGLFLLPLRRSQLAIKHKRLIVVTFALEDVPNCSCLRLSRLDIFGVLGCCYFIGRVFMKASALRWT